MFGRKKRNQKQYIIISTDDRGVHHHNVTRRRIFALMSLSIILLAVVFFFSANALTDILYKLKIEKIKQNYSSLSSTLVGLQNQMIEISSTIETIEDKDKALRTYADMPVVDQDVKKLGIGGVRLADNTNMEDKFTDRLKSLEMDVDALTRKVKLELFSYTDIFDKVTDNVDLILSIPSIRPVESGYLNSSFGYRKDPLNGEIRFHYGQDITVNRGETVLAPANGTIKDARYMGGYGKVIKIDHGYGYTTLYAHLSKIYVKKGQKIKRGDKIGLSGNTGRSTAPHLHYEVHQYGTPQNPLDYFFSGYLK